MYILLCTSVVNGRLLVILVVVVGLVGSIGVIISAVALSRPSIPTVTITQSDGSTSLIAQWLQMNQGQGTEEEVEPPTKPKPPGDVVTQEAPTGAPDEASAGRRKRAVEMLQGYSRYATDRIWTIAVGNDNGGYDYL